MISHDTEFKQALDKLSLDQQRQIGAAFVTQALQQTPDAVLAKVLTVAADPQASEEELATAFRSAKAIALDRHTRCGADGDWQNQASYFLARAASALVASAKQAKAPAWEAAANVRLARTCGMIEQADSSMHEESEAQYQLLLQFLAQQKEKGHG